MCLMWAVRATGPNDKFRAIGFEKMGFEKREPASAEPMCTEPLSAMAASAIWWQACGLVTPANVK
jgi:hypothetical protein